MEADSAASQHLDLPGRERDRVRDISPSAVSATSTSTSSSVSAQEQYAPSRPGARSEQPDLVISSQLPPHAAANEHSPTNSPERRDQPEPVADAEQPVPYGRDSFGALVDQMEPSAVFSSNSMTQLIIGSIVTN